MNEVIREGSGYRILGTEDVTIDDALAALDAVEAAGPCDYVIVDLSLAKTVQFSLDDAHLLARRMRQSTTRGRRHAYVVRTADAQRTSRRWRR